MDLYGLTMATASTPIPLPSYLDTTGDLGSNWKRWRQVWNSYEIVSGLDGKENEFRVATFITCVGQKGLEILEGLPFQNDEDRNKIDTILNLFEKFCVGEKKCDL